MAAKKNDEEIRERALELSLEAERTLLTFNAPARKTILDRAALYYKFLKGEAQ